MISRWQFWVYVFYVLNKTTTSTTGYLDFYLKGLSEKRMIINGKELSGKERTVLRYFLSLRDLTSDFNKEDREAYESLQELTRIPSGTKVRAECGDGSVIFGVVEAYDNGIFEIIDDERIGHFVNESGCE